MPIPSGTAIGGALLTALLFLSVPALAAGAPASPTASARRLPTLEPASRPFPDLVVRDMRATRRCKIQLTIANTGAAGVPDSAYHPTEGAAVQMMHGPKGTEPFGGARLNSIDPGRKLKTPGASVTYVWFPGAANLTLTEGAREYRVVVDVNRAVKESNELNNILVRKLSCPALAPAR